MTTSFPTALDSFTNPTSADNLNTPAVLHTDQHANKNDAIEALEAKVGINGSAIVTSLDYKIVTLLNDAIRRVATAIIAGDFTGNARGAQAIDLQTGRLNDTEVASGESSFAVGRENIVSGNNSGAVGLECEVTGNVSFAFGDLVVVSGNASIGVGNNAAVAGANSQGIGRNSVASALDTTAIGYGAQATGASGAAIGKDTIASGADSTAIGKSAQATGNQANAIGSSTVASGLVSIAIGDAAAAAAEGAQAIGPGSYAAGLYSQALGTSATANIGYTTNISGAQIVGAGFGIGETNWQAYFSGAEIIIMSDIVNLKIVADYTVSLSTGCHFWWSECGIICTEQTGMTIQPTVRFGISGTLAKQVAAIITTLLTAAFKRQAFTPLVPQDGETSLSAGITVGATATNMSGRFYFKGMLVED